MLEEKIFPLPGRKREFEKRLLAFAGMGRWRRRSCGGVGSFAGAVGV
jgi:hypothetical protein